MTTVQRLGTALGGVMLGPLLISPKRFGDQRGFFFESWNQRLFDQLLIEDGQGPIGFVQDNHSRSSRGVLRGLHYQVSPHSQGKLVRCVVGEIYDVAVDLRLGSTTYGQWVGAHLTADQGQQLWIPAGFAHGFLTLSEVADVLYKATDFWAPDCERSIVWNDPQIAIDWPMASMGSMTSQPILSVKDAQAPCLADQPCVF
jgi:dTDP-4-dehydrorhamnose 3,5-epimerase